MKEIESKRKASQQHNQKVYLCPPQLSSNTHTSLKSKIHSLHSEFKNYNVSQYLPQRQYLNYPIQQSITKQPKNTPPPQKQNNPFFSNNFPNITNTAINTQPLFQANIGKIKKKQKKFINSCIQTKVHHLTLSNQPVVSLKITPTAVLKERSIQTVNAQKSQQTNRVFTQQIESRQLRMQNSEIILGRRRQQQVGKGIRFKGKNPIYLKPKKAYQSSYCFQKQFKSIARQLMNIK